MKRVSGLLAGLLVGSALAQTATPAPHAFAPLLQALKRAEKFELTGEVQTSVYFPPRPDPTRTVKVLPRLEVVPWLLRKNFDLSVGDLEQVAGRNAQRYDLTPKNTAAARWTLWLDPAARLPLAFEERAPDGTLVRRAAFNKVTGKPRLRAIAAVPAVRDSAVKPALLAALPGLRLPRSFEPVRAQRRAQGLEVVLSDGLNVLALVIAPRRVQPAQGVAVRRLPGGFVWLVGNLPQSDLDGALARVQTVQQDALGTFDAPPVSNP